MLCNSLRSITSTDIKVGVYLWGDDDILNNVSWWSKKLGVDYEYLLESKCENTINYLHLLFDTGEPEEVEMPYIRNGKHNMYIFTLAPKYHQWSDDRISHTWALIRQDDRYILVDSYAAHYVMRIRCFDKQQFDHLLLSCSRFINDTDAESWFDITGVRENINYIDTYGLEILAYTIDLHSHTIDDRRKSMYIRGLELIRGPSRGNSYPSGSRKYEEYEYRRNKYRSDELTSILGFEDEDMLQGTINTLTELLEH